MRNSLKSFFVILLALLAIYSSQLTANAALPHLINYQGRLTDTNGAPLNGSYNITFRIYDALTAGNLLWQGTYTNVSINKGIFSVLLGDISDTGFNFASLAFDIPYFLEIKVGTDAPMQPRQRVTSTGYSIRTEKAEKVETTAVKNSIEINNNQAQFVNDNASPGNSKYYGTDSGGTKGWYGIPANVVFSFALGGGSAQTANRCGIIMDATIRGSYDKIASGYWATHTTTVDTSPKTILKTKFKKLATISVITIYCSMWQDALSLGNSAVVKVDIGGQSNSVTGTPNQITPEWKSFDIDVSSLTNETVYDVNIQLGANGITRNGYLDSIIGLAK